MQTIGIYLFDRFEELDAVGPWEVLSAWTLEHPGDGWQVQLIADDLAPITAAKGMAVVPHATRDIDLDIVLVPGGVGTRTVMTDASVLGWLRGLHAAGHLVTSVCTGALVLAAAGLLRGRPATTYHQSFDDLEAIEPTVASRRDVRWVDDGDIVTSAGVSAGIDMALHLVSRLVSVERARSVRDLIEYHPDPPV
ncbi:DJ-1/PfpI family protein [Williamsia sp. CHRR-6]|uniref:DJ-1/PfpI family protein n=1 Tax=Williamsia sp. CHRR-6 TaxID=2835871 RepID=UPI001BDA7BED|nr:DJ-1/PfpI family protein [Williamsia sp. CHRR-6]MBT0566658.1 DJ-1/PfpI family protein [Williamsia sp. CHRR-6]